MKVLLPSLAILVIGILIGYAIRPLCEWLGNGVVKIVGLGRKDEKL